MYAVTLSSDFITRITLRIGFRIDRIMVVMTKLLYLKSTRCCIDQKLKIDDDQIIRIIASIWTVVNENKSFQKLRKAKDRKDQPIMRAVQIPYIEDANSSRFFSNFTSP